LTWFRLEDKALVTGFKKILNNSLHLVIGLLRTVAESGEFIGLLQIVAVHREIEVFGMRSQ
jgi:hypothetical protein